MANTQSESTNGAWADERRRVAATDTPRQLPLPRPRDVEDESPVAEPAALSELSRVRDLALLAILVLAEALWLGAIVYAV